MRKISAESLKMAQEAYDNGLTYEICASGAKVFQAIKRERWGGARVPAKKFTTRVSADLPRLAWLCEIANGEYEFTCGAGVETGDDYAVEGVWAGEFANKDFDVSDHFYGSGARVAADGAVVFVPPRHCADYLYVIRDEKSRKTFVSNSFCFIFQRLNLDLKGDFFRAFKNALNHTTNAEAARGADRGSPVITLAGGYAAYRLTYHNFTIGENGEPNIEPLLPAKIPVMSFADYKAFLLHVTKSLLANGADAARSNPFGAISTLSTGYDSCAVSAVCAIAGVKDAVTLDVVTLGHDDNGEKIARALNMNCHVALSPLGKVVPSLKARFSGDEYLEFLATPGIGDNVAFCGMEPYIASKIVFSGLYGDGVWSKKGLGGGLPHSLPYMKSRGEFRLRAGYCLAPTPAFGAYLPWALKRVSADKQMSNYSVGGDYDRPVPRALAEEAGVPREFFGERKAANNPEVLNWKEHFDRAVASVMKRYN